MIKRLGTQLTALLEEPGRMSLPKFAVARGLWALHFPNYRSDDDKTLLVGFCFLIAPPASSH